MGDEPQTTSRGPWPHRARLAAFALLSTFIVFGPFYRQVLGGESPIFRRWVMYRGVGSQLVDARFYQRLPDGRELEIDRYAVLGHPDPRRAPRDLWRIQGSESAHAIARELCGRLGLDADVRVRSRLGSLERWKPGDRGDRNLCRQPPAEDGEAPVQVGP